MDIQGPRRNKKARDRQMARRRRRDQLASQRQADTPTRSRRSSARGSENSRSLSIILGDLAWHLRRNRWIVQGIGGAVVVMLIIFVLSFAISGRVYPNVSAMGVNVGGMSMDDAAARLREAWLTEIPIQVVVKGEVVSVLSPQDLGLQLDAAATAAAAKSVGFRQGMFGTDVMPVVTLPDAGYLAVQSYLLDMTTEINTAPFNAGFQWQGENLLTVSGRAGQLLDIAPTLAAIKDDPATVVAQRQFNVVVSPVHPDVQDSTNYVDIVRDFTNQPFAIRGYDPFADTFTNWSTDRDTLTSWIEVSSAGLTLREEAFAPFLNAQTDSLNADQNRATRYLNVEETMQVMRDAIASQTSEVDIRIRYRPVDYVVEPGDTASKISRKTGIPFYLIQQHNPGRDLDVLSIGDTLNMPTRDVTMPHTPIIGKRIVVDLEKQELWAFENGELIFNWEISSGQSSAPTSPGIYQVLSHTEKAYGSSFTLCDESLGCGQWEMSWFMGMYEVVPGLMNGFHGAVLLPNGAYLNGGATGYPSTFGCVMAHNDDAKLLYDWAEQGTVVEIISREFEPLSVVAQSTQQT